MLYNPSKKHEVQTLHKVETSTWLVSQPAKTAEDVVQFIQSIEKLIAPVKSDLKNVKEIKKSTSQENETQNIFSHLSRVF